MVYAVFRTSGYFALSSTVYRLLVWNALDDIKTIRLYFIQLHIKDDRGARCSSVL